MSDKDDQLKQMADVLTGRLRLKLTAKKTKTDEYVDALIRANRKDQAKMSEAHFRAALIRGC